MTIVTPRDIGSVDKIESDLCIIGAGAAGITLARELVDSGLKITLLAGGGEAFSHRAQLLYHGRNIGRESFAIGKSRFRMFGGSTTRWAGQCRPFDPVDFEPREGMAASGWPIKAKELAAYYRRAADICDLDDWRFDPPNLAALPKDIANDVEPVRYRHGHSIDFASAYGADLQVSDNIRVFLETHAVDIVRNVRRISHVSARTTNGHAFRFEADTFILACGGIENARLLLASRSTDENGLGNANNLVGRYFMDHPFFFGGHLDLAPGVGPDAIEALDGYEQAGIAQRSHGAFALSEGVRRKHGVNGAAVFFVKRAAHKSSETFLSQGGVSMTRVLDVLLHRELPDGRLKRHVAALLAHPGQVAHSTLERIKGSVEKRHTLAARFTLETVPNPDSRVRLNPRRRDRFGMPLVTVDWRLDKQDLRGLELIQQGLPGLIESMGVGRLSLHGDKDKDGFPFSMEGGKHHMGTTRMSDDPGAGVVDPNCRLHEVDNMFVAGSSVFPTSGYVNPTLTIVALAIRLADHLRQTDPNGI
ncbi:MAG: GMC family oxidoreductase [Pseudomonadota bacterium]